MDERTGDWFGTTPSGRFGPIAWQGRFALGLYLVLVLFAVAIYADLQLICTVVGLYTLILGGVVLVKSDLADRLRPPR
jgi:hypothetical protein